MAGDVDVEKFGRSKVYFSASSVPISKVFDFANDFIIVVRKDMTTVEINTPFIEYLGIMEKDRFIGKNVKNLPLADSPKMTDDISEVLEKQEILEDVINYKGNRGSKSDRFLAKFVPTALKDGEKGVTVILSKISDK